MFPCDDQKDFINRILGTLSTTHFLSHEIMGWYWRAPTSCVMLWDFTGNQRRQNAEAVLMVAPCVSESEQLWFQHKALNGTHLWNLWWPQSYIDQLLVMDRLTHSNIYLFHVALKVTYYAKIIYINMCPLCVKRFWKFQEKKLITWISS